MKTKLDHINISVLNIHQSIDWYKNAFEFDLLEDRLDMKDEPWAIVGKDDFMICMHEDKNLLSADSLRDEIHSKINHFGLRVSDREEWERRIKKYHIKVLYGGAHKYPNSISWYVLDPSGHEIEISYADNKPLRF